MALSTGQQALGRIVQSLLADADGFYGAQLSDLARVVESYRDAVIARRMLPLTLRGAKTNGQWFWFAWSAGGLYPGLDGGAE